MKLLSLAIAAVSISGAAAFSAITPGTKLPSVELHSGFPPTFVNIADATKGRKTLIVGLPGDPVPGYLENQDALKEAGVDEVIVYCVNDGAVMMAWEKDQGTEGSMVTMLADPAGTFTKAVGMEMTDDGPPSVGIIGRCKRYAMLVVDGEVKKVAIAESELDPAGDDFPEKTLAPALLEWAKE